MRMIGFQRSGRLNGQMGTIGESHDNGYEIAFKLGYGLYLAV